MTIEEKKEILTNHPFFFGLDEKTINFIAERVQDKIYPPHSIILKQGDLSNAVYFTYSGILKVYLINEAGKQIPVKTSEEKDFMGDLGAFDGKPTHATIETIQETHVLILPKKDFIYALENFPKFSYNLLIAWAKKVRIINKQREISFSLELQDRTILTLKTLANHFPQREVTLTHEELAGIVGATRSRVTEVLHELEKQKMIKLSNHKISVL